ncbi:MAG TPA: S8 family peptidase [Desertimonas sp.]|nr:S8 family peptidase [Desertimonas sp.]
MRASHQSILVTVALAASLIIPTGVTAADSTAPPSSADEVVVRYRADATLAQRRAVPRDLGLDVVSTSKNGRTQVVVGHGLSTATVRRRLDADPRVLAVAPNHRRELAADPTSEPGFPSQWGLHNTGQHLEGTEAKTGIADIDIDGLEALRITQGDPSIVVAIIDDGVDFSHPDLVGAAWTNPGEIAGNGLDDDGNGFPDDIHGWDFCNGNASVHDAGQDAHGTHVAGTIGASPNGSGVVGVAPAIQIMAVKFIDDSGDCGTDGMAIEAIDYAASFDVPIINASWGGSQDSNPLENAIAESNALFVAASGNAGRNIDSGTYNFYPAEFPLANVLSVAAIDQRGSLARFSNYGATTVDVSAPGTNILSSWPAEPGCSPCWAWSAGTSMAAPHVSGVAALYAGTVTGSVTPTLLKSMVLTRANALAPTVGKTVSGRLVSAWRAADMAGPTAQAISSHRITAGTIIGSTVGTTLSWPPATDDHSGVPSYVVRRRIGSGAWTVLAGTVTSRSFNVSMAFGTPTQFAVSGRDGAGNVGTQAVSPAVTATLYQERTSLARYSGRWTNTSSSTASHSNLRTSTQAGAWVEFKRDARSIAIVGRQGPTSGKAKVYVDGVFAATIDLYRSTSRSRVVLFSRAWSTPGLHTVKLFVSGTPGRPRVDIDAFGVLR